MNWWIRRELVGRSNPLSILNVVDFSVCWLGDEADKDPCAWLIPTYRISLLISLPLRSRELKFLHARHISDFPSFRDAVRAIPSTVNRSRFVVLQLPRFRDRNLHRITEPACRVTN